MSGKSKKQEEETVKSPDVVQKGAEFHALGQEETEELLKVLKKYRKSLYKFRGVYKVDIGYRWKDGRMTGEIAIRVHVRKKRPVEELDSNEVVPEELDGLPVDVIESNITLHRTTRQDPLVGGIETRNVNMIGVGTLGAVVFDAADGSPMALSNRHVFVGSRPGEATGDQANQPGTVVSEDAIGTVARSSRIYDSAVVSLNGSRKISTSIIGYPGGIKGVVRPVPGMLVAKSGRTTLITHGMIEGVSEKEFTIVPVPGHNSGEISLGGDSGSIWLEETSHAAVGLHYGGETSQEPEDERAWAKRITRVASALKILMRQKIILPHSSASGPALAAKSNAILLGWTGTGNLQLNFMQLTDGLTYTGRVIPGETSPSALSLTVFMDKFIVAWTTTGNRWLNIMQSDDGITWGEKVTLSETTLSSPVLAVYENQLFLSWRSIDNNTLNVMQSPDGRIWQNKRTLNESTFSGPALAAFGGKLYLGWREAGSNRLNILSSSDGLTFTDRKIYNDTTTSRPCLYGNADRLCYAWQGVGTRFLNIFESDNGTNFAGKITLRETCSYGPALTAFGNDLVWCWTSADDHHRLNILRYSL